MINMNKYWNDYTQDERDEMLIKAKEGDKQTLAKIWLSVEKAVQKRAHNFKWIAGSLTIEDLTQEGFAVFMKSIKHFDMDKGTNFLGYFLNSYGNTIHKVIASKGESISLPAHWNELKFKISKAMKACEVSKITDDNIDMIAEESGLTKSIIKTITETLIANPVVVMEDEFNASAPTEDNEMSEEGIRKLELIFETLNKDEIKVFRSVIGLGVDQITFKMAQAKYDLSRRKLDAIMNKARKVANG